jgi:hypothetical protein
MEASNRGPGRALVVYLGLAVVFAASVICAVLLPVEGLIRDVALVPGLGAMCAAVWQLLRDREAHNRQLDLKQREQLFSLSVTSHMAQVAFDKHAAFCQDYVARVHKGVGELYRDGPSQHAITIVQDLAEIRQRHAPWVPPDVLERLKPFEEAVWEVGTSSLYVARAGEAPDRRKHVDKMHNTFSEVLGIPSDDVKGRPEVRVDLILAQLQDVLGIRELSRLRAAVIKNAMQNLEGTGN